MIARGPLCELDTQPRIAGELGYIDDPEPLLNTVDRLLGRLGSLIQRIKARATS